MASRSIPAPTPFRRVASDASRRCLVVVNQTDCGIALVATVRARIRRGCRSFHVLVPAAPDGRGMTWTEGDVAREAADRLEVTVRALRAVGADATGEIGDHSALSAIEDVLRDNRFDEVILSSPAPGVSRWMGLDLPHRLANRLGLPVTQVA